MLTTIRTFERRALELAFQDSDIKSRTLKMTFFIRPFGVGEKPTDHKKPAIKVIWEGFLIRGRGAENISRI